MDSTFMNSKNSETPDPYRLSINLSDRVKKLKKDNLKRSDRYVS